MKYFLVIDFETSGLPQEGAQPVEMGAVILDKKDLSPLDEFQIFIQHDPERFTWSQVAEDLHGITREALQESGLPLADAWGAFLDWLSRWIDLGARGRSCWPVIMSILTSDSSKSWPIVRRTRT